jgi:hypothetical protein
MSGGTSAWVTPVAAMVIAASNNIVRIDFT